MIEKDRKQITESHELNMIRQAAAEEAGPMAVAEAFQAVVPTTSETLDKTNFLWLEIFA